MLSRRLLLPFTLLVPLCAVGQWNYANSGNLKVRVWYPNGRHCQTQVKVELMDGSSNTPVTQAYTTNEGMVDFLSVKAGHYHLVVSGEGIQETDSGVIEVDTRKETQSIDITVKLTDEDNSSQNGRPSTPTVAVADFNVPEAARKELDKANDQMAKENWKKALDHLQKALAIYPKYAAAYNNAAVVYSRLGNRPAEREALGKAIGLDDHMAAAYVNLAKMNIVDKNFPEAETLLNKAASAEPNNAETLMLLADMQLLDRHFEEAIANCRKVHSMPHSSQTLAHYIAARALEHENRLADAVGELHTFLQEEPSGPRAEAVRKEMTVLESYHR